MFHLLTVSLEDGRARGIIYLTSLLPREVPRPLVGQAVSEDMTQSSGTQESPSPTTPSSPLRYPGLSLVDCKDPSPLIGR